MVTGCFPSGFLFSECILVWSMVASLVPCHGSFFQNGPSSPSTLDCGTPLTYHPADSNSSSSMLSYLFPKVPQNIPGNLITEHSLCMTCCNFRATYQIWAHIFFKSSPPLRYSWPYNWTPADQFLPILNLLTNNPGISRINSPLSIMTGIYSSILIYIIY